MPKHKLLMEYEWRALGVIQSFGWVHYEIFNPEPFILLFRRPLGTDPLTGIPPIDHPFSQIHLLQTNGIGLNLSYKGDQ